MRQFMWVCWVFSLLQIFSNDSSAFWKALDWHSEHQSLCQQSAYRNNAQPLFLKHNLKGEMLRDEDNSASKATQALALSSENKDQFVSTLLHLFFFANSVESIFQCLSLLDSLTIDWVNFPYLMVIILVISGRAAVHSVWFLWTPIPCSQYVALTSCKWCDISYLVTSWVSHAWSPTFISELFSPTTFSHTSTHILCLLVSKWSCLVSYSSYRLWAGCVSSKVWRWSQHAAGVTR